MVRCCRCEEGCFELVISLRTKPNATQPSQETAGQTLQLYEVRCRKLRVSIDAQGFCLPLRIASGQDCTNGKAGDECLGTSISAGEENSSRSRNHLRRSRQETPVARRGARGGICDGWLPERERIPWHRVVGAGGRLLISEPHASLQRKLLASEGIAIDGRRIDMKRYAWSPGAQKASMRRQTRHVKGTPAEFAPELRL